MDARFARAQRGLLLTLTFLVVLAVCPLTTEAAVDPKVLLYELGAFAMLGLWLFAPGSTRPPFWSRSPVVLALVAFVLANLAGAAASLNPGYSFFRECTGWAALGIVFVVTASAVRTPDRAWQLVVGICIAVAIASVYGMVQFMGWDPFPWEDTTGMLRSAPATFGNPNVASHTMMPAIILAAGGAVCTKRRWLALLLPLFVAHFALTRTRGALLGLACGVALLALALLVAKKVRVPSRATGATLGIAVMAALLALALASAGFTLVSGKPKPDDENLTMRSHSFYEACLMIQDRPALGHGPGMFPAASPPYWTWFEKQRFHDLNRMNFHVHNEPLEFAAETGVFGGIAYVSFLVLCLCTALFMAFQPADPQRRILGFTLATFFAAFFVDGLFGFNAHMPASAFILFLLAGVTTGLSLPSAEPARGTPERLKGLGLVWRVAVVLLALNIPLLTLRDYAAKVYQQRGTAAAFHKAYQPAKESFSKAVALAPFDWMARYHLGTALLNSGRAGEAAQHFSDALKLNPNFITAEFQLSRALFNMAASLPEGGWEQAAEEAIRHARHASQLSPHSPEPYDVMGRTLYLRAQRLTQANGGDPPPAAREACVEAESHLLEAVERGAEDADTLYLLMAEARALRGNAAGAYQVLNTLGEGAS